MFSCDDIPAPLDERIETLICRCLDGEADATERAELDFVLAHDPLARSVYEDYRSIDELAGAALRQDFAKAMTAAASRPRRGLWLATAGAALATAAVLLFAVQWRTSAPGIAPDPMKIFPANPAAGSGGAMVVSTNPQSLGDAPPRLLARPNGEAIPVDYQFINPHPSRDHREHQRDMIGIRGDDKNVIYVLERDTTSSKVVPISCDF